MDRIFDAEAMKTVVVDSMSQLGSDLASFAPKVFGVIALLTIGWLVSRTVQAIAGGLLSRAGLDEASDRLGVRETLSQSGVERPVSGIIARMLFWLSMLTFVLSAVETLGLTAVTSTIDRLIAYLPNVLAATLIIILGLVVSRFVGNLVASGAAAAQMPYAGRIGSVARGALVVAVAILATEQLGVDTSLLLGIVITLLAALTLGLALSFALGSREVVGAILAGHYLRKSLRAGGSVRLEGREGVLERVGPVDTLFRNGDLWWSVPNGVLLKAIVDRGPSSPETGQEAS